MLPTWISRAQELWNEWAIRITVPLSLLLHIILLLVADTRRYNDVCPWWRFVLWVVYQLLDVVGSYALSHLSLDDTGDDAEKESEQLLVAFWGPFLLLQLGGPDNLGAYSLDDDKMSWRKLFAGLFKLLAAFYIFVTKIRFADGVGLLLPASCIMLAVGVLRFFENVWAMVEALRTTPLDGSGKEKTTMTQMEAAKDMLSDPSHERGWRDKQAGWRAIVAAEWKKLDKEATEKANKIYDVVYTKAGQVHTWRGYLLRLVSPLATATALVLFGLYPKDCAQAADVAITYILLSFALVLEVGWLVAALASDSAKELAEAYWPRFLFRRQILRCGGWWDELCCMALLLHPWRLLGVDPSAYRMRLGSSVGRFDLVRECTRAPGRKECLRAWLWWFIGQGATWDDFRARECSSQLSEGEKQVLFERIMARLKLNDQTTTTTAPMESHILQRRNKKKLHEPKFFHEDVLLWHIGTTIYLYSIDQQDEIAKHAKTKELSKAIEVVSEYLMFLAAARPHMLPDPPLRRLYKFTEIFLRNLYKDHHRSGSRKKKLADILRTKQKEDKLYSQKDGTTSLISDAAELAIRLQTADAGLHCVLDFVLDVWVEKLLNAAIRCSRESHARQLGRGGELLTIVWIAADYAGVFIIGGETHTVHRDTPPDPDPEQQDGRCCPKEKAETTCHCHQDRLEHVVCPHTCCMTDYYCCTQDYDYC